MKKTKYFTRQILPAILLVCISVLYTNAQTGPGGVGNNQGAGNLKFWLRGDSASIDVGVDTLYDLSGYGNHFIQSNTSYQPAISTINGFNVLDFDGTGDYLMDSDGESYINGQSAFTLLIVIKSDNASTDKGFFIADTPGGNDDSLSIRYDITGDNGGQSNIITAGTGANGPIESSAGAQSTSNQLVTFSWVSNNTPELYIDGTSNVLSYGNIIVGSISGSDEVILGKGSQDTGVGDGWDGIIAEVIFFNKKLNSAERTIVENYLSTRYNLTISNDEYTPADAGFIYDVIGIGIESDGDHNGSVSAGFGINEDNSSLDVNGEYVFASHDNTTNDIASIKTDVEVTTPLGAGGAAWNRSWYLAKSGGAGVDLRISFDFGNGIDGGGIPQNVSNYRLLYRAGTSGNYSVVTTSEQGIQSGDQVYFDVVNANILNGYYTIGTTDQTNSPVEGSNSQTWYTLVSGNWEDTGNDNIWTLDPSGALPNNPLDEIPDASDNVVILSGKTVTVNANNYNLNSIEVEGRLYLGSTNGHDFTSIGGNGRIYVEGDYFPAGDSTDFITPGLGEGTVVYSGGANFDLTVSRTFYNMEIIMDDASDVVTLECDYKLNGNLKIETGELQFNDNTNTTPLVLEIDGDIDVYSNGSLTVGTANAYVNNVGGTYGDYYEGFHQIIVGGDFSNQGTVRLTNLAVPDYSIDPATAGGAVSLIFTGAVNSTLTCENTTDLYNLVIDKGTDQTYQLHIYAEDTSYFALFGDNDNNWNYGATATENANPETQKALWIKAGTLKLSGEIYIPSLTEGTRDFTIGDNARLLLDGPNVFVSNTANELSTYTGLSHGTPNSVDNGQGSQGLYLLGKLQVNNGKFLLGEAEAINFRDEAPGVIVVNGGELEANQIAISSSATRGDFSFIQTAGIVRLTSQYNADTDNALLHLNDADMTFTMSGGEIVLEGVAPTDPATETNGIWIASSEGNYNVTGGKVRIDYDTGGTTDVEINSTANFYNFEVDTNTYVILENDLTVSNDLTIFDGAQFDSDGNDVAVGRDFSINYQSTYLHQNNTTTFNGTEDGSLYIGYPIENDSYEQHFYDFVLNKPSDKSLTVTGDLEKTAQYQEDNGYSHTIASLVQIENALTIESGILNQGEHSIRLAGPITVEKDGQCGVYVPGTTHLYAMIILQDANTNINTENGAVFGNIKMNPSPSTDIITFTSDVYIKRISYFDGRINLQTYNLTVDYLHEQLTTTNYDIADGNATDEMFYSAGNASDGGVSILITGNGTYGFPLGVSGKYTPAEVIVTDYSDDGYITIRPNEGELKTTDPGGGDILTYYWRVGYSDFTTLPTTAYNFIYDDANIVGNENQYRSGRVLDEDPYTRSSENNVTPGSNLIYYSANTLVKANYTAGVVNRFNGALDIYYSESTGTLTWSDNNDWHRGSPTGPNFVPSDGSIVKIMGDARMNVDVASFADLALVEFEQTNTSPTSENVGRLQFLVSGTYDLGTVRDTGMISFDATQTINITADFGDFGINPVSYYLYFGGDATVNTIPTPIPNLMFESADYTIDQDITVNTDLIIQGNATVTPVQDVQINDDLIIGCWQGGTFEFPGTGNSITVTVDDDIDFTDDPFADPQDRNIVVNNPGVASTLEHTLVVKDDIIHGPGNGYDIDLFNATNRPAVIVEFQGDSTQEYYRTSTAVPDFYRIVVNKGSDQTDTIIFQDDFTLSGPTNGTTKALELQNGVLKLNDADIDIDLSTGGGDFEIPSTTCLQVTQGTVNVSGDDNGIWLDGKLLIDGGTVDMDDPNYPATTNGNNYIEYTASGSSEIEISGGSLLVGSQIRRNLYPEEGVLSFTQTGGTVTLGLNDAPEGDRGVLEILNSGSSLTMGAGTNITIVQQQTNPSIAALYLYPETSSLGTGSSFTFGNTSTPASQTIGINSNINLKNIIVGTTNSPTLQLQVLPLTIEEDVTINSGGSFDANGLSVTIKGDMINSGTYIPNGNITTFSGSSDQQITGDTDFYTLIKSTSNALNLNGTTSTDIDIQNDFTISSGTFRDSSNAVTIQGDLDNEGTHVFGGTGNGLEMNGTSSQSLSGSGTFGKLTISNSTGVNVPTGNQITIVDALNLNGGILDVGSNLLDLGVDADIIEGTAFSNTNMIRTNISFTDNGVQKTFKSTADAGGSYNFKIPIGSGSKYTPVEYKITANGNSTGSIITKAADEMHPSIIEDSETPEIVDEDNVLQYHWVINSDGISGFSADVEMQYYPADVYVTSPYNITDYITARLLSDGSGSWNKFDVDDFDESNNLCIFNFDGVGDDEIGGDYTAGIDSAIPNQVPFYETNQSGSWTNGNIWTPFISGGPRGAMVRINTDDTVYMPSNFQSSYTTTINGTLKVDSTFGHRLGDVDGTGTLYTKRSSLPAGYYAEFFSSSGGTLEYSGSASYDILAGYPTINNLKLSGTGERRFPNLDVTLLGDLTIDGDDVTLEVINDHDQKISIGGDISFVTGAFDAGAGANAIVEMNGAVAQSITGNFTGTNDFYHFTLNNANGLILNGPVDIYGDLTLTSGIITTSAANILSLTDVFNTVSGYSSSNYIDGPMRKNLSNGSTFEFPVGDASRYGLVEVISTSTSGSQYWETEYYNANPDLHVPSLDTSSREAGLQRISGNEYWRIEGPASGQSHVEIRWDGNSILPAMTSDRSSNLKLVEWIDGSSEWQVVGTTVTDNGINDGTIQTDAVVALDEHYFTIGTAESAPLPAAGFLTLDTAVCNGSTVGLRVQLEGSPNWTLYVWDGTSTTTYGPTGSSLYTFNVSPATTTTYTIDSVGDNTGVTTGATIFGSPVTVTVSNIPSAYNVTGGGSFCSGGTGVAVGLDGSEIGMTYELYIDGAPSGSTVAGDGAAISFGNQTTAGNYTVEATNDANTNCSQTMTGSVNVVVNPLPTVTLTVNALLDTICNGDNTEIEIDFTAGTAPFDFTVSRDDEVPATITEDFTNISTDPYTYTPAGAPAWVDDGSPETNYIYSITTITDNNGCTNNTEQGNVQVTVYKLPETGPQYHVGNKWNN